MLIIVSETHGQFVTLLTGVVIRVEDTFLRLREDRQQVPLEDFHAID
jgi:hypothetical protein